ncbi:MAG: hypothetical protein BGP06_17765 [Rhizobiales bacterium 65-9]|nr:hypothetical protein [Hyphomicrobiales bacterium]OJY34695.1 MAG: hypothetical protein BGP06_17765 [Rhizobiales bacterium 65-9]
MKFSPATRMGPPGPPGPMRLAARLLAALLVILAIAPPVAAHSLSHGPGAGRYVATGAHSFSPTQDCESAGGRKDPAASCFACPSLCCFAALPAIADPMLASPAPGERRPLMKAKRLTGAGPSLDPPPPRGARPYA